MPKKVSTAEQSLESIMWNCRNALRGTVGGNEMANPPFNLKLNAQGVTQGKLNGDVRGDGYSTPPVSNANYAWILHILSKLDVINGIAGFLLANGALNADGTEGDIRRELVENDKVEAIVVLPREMFQIDYATEMARIQGEKREVLKESVEAVTDNAGSGV